MTGKTPEQICRGTLANVMAICPEQVCLDDPIYGAALDSFEIVDLVTRMEVESGYRCDFSCTIPYTWRDLLRCFHVVEQTHN